MAARLALICFVCCLASLPATAQVACVDWTEVPPTSDQHPAPDHAEARISNIIDAGDCYVVGGYAGYQDGFFLASYRRDTGEFVDESRVGTSFDSLIRRPGCVVAANLSVGYSVFTIEDDGEIGYQMSHHVGDYCKDVAPLGQTMMLSANWGYLGVVDLADPWNPESVALVPLPNCGRVTVAGDVAYALTNGAFVSIDLSDPTTPVVLTQVDLPGPPNDLDVDPPYLAVACGGEAGVTVYDVSDPAAPVLMGSAPVEGLPFRVEVVHDHAYVMVRDGYDSGQYLLDALQLVALSTEAPPTDLGLFAPCWEATNVVFWDGRIVWPDASPDVRSYPPQCPQVVGAPEPAPTPAPCLLPARPNPFNPVTELVFNLPRAAMVRLTIHAADGRLVATVYEGWRGEGRHRIVWTGRDRAGRQVASGTYLARLQAGDQLETETLTLVR